MTEMTFNSSCFEGLNQRGSCSLFLFSDSVFSIEQTQRLIHMFFIGFKI
jgi:hypothetical protein